MFWKKKVKPPERQHFYGHDLWSEVAQEIVDRIPKNYIIYGEVLGWTKEGAPIQNGYTYLIPQGHHELYIYRVAQINPQGILVDLSWDQVKEFCNNAGLNHVPELWSGLHRDFSADDWMNKRYFDEGYSQALPLENGTKKNPIVDEGVCIRVEGLVPYVLKLKSPVFYEYETKQLDKEVVDIESAEAA